MRGRHPLIDRLGVALAAEQVDETREDPLLEDMARIGRHWADAAEKDGLERSLEGCTAKLEAVKDEEVPALSRDRQRRQESIRR